MEIWVPTIPMFQHSTIPVPDYSNTPLLHYSIPQPILESFGNFFTMTSDLVIENGYEVGCPDTVGDTENCPVQAAGNWD